MKWGAIRSIIGVKILFPNIIAWGYPAEEKEQQDRDDESRVYSLCGVRVGKERVVC